MTPGDSVSTLDFALRVALALVCGSLIGIERQWRARMAGLRTNALVATGSSLFVMITPLVHETATKTQIAAYVVSGIGFLAGGVIFKERTSVTGLNTAATLWCTAAIGALIGFGFVVDAAIGVVAILAANVALRPLARFINRRPVGESEIVSSYEIRAICLHEVEEAVRTAMVAAVKHLAMTLTAVYSEDLDHDEHRVEVIADVTVAGRPDARLERVISRLAVEAGVASVSWKVVPTSDEEREILPET